MKVRLNKALEFLLARGNLPILYWLKKDILEVPVDRECKNLCKFGARIRILESQRSDGSWTRKKLLRHPRWEKTYHLIETLKSVSRLYDYGCSLKDEGIQKAVQFLFSTQTREGDFRGFYFNEYAPTYHALTLEVLCRYGLHKDKRIQKGFRWILANRQDDGGWAIPYQTIDQEKLKSRINLKGRLKAEPFKPDKSQPSSHLVTGMVLRALAESPSWRKSKEAWKVGVMIIDHFFQADNYDNRHRPSFWEEITYPFWSTDILSSLDSLSKIGFGLDNEKIRQALDWLLKEQNSQGIWESRDEKAALEDHLWMTIAVLRVLKRFQLFKI